MPKEHRIEIESNEICYFEWGRRSLDRTTVLLVHAAGFHARVWDATVSLVRDAVPDSHMLALDMRGLGRSGNTPPIEWSQFGRDVVSFVDRLDLREVVGVGHSMGGHSVTQACALRPEKFKSLLLVDPVIMAPESYLSKKNQNYSSVDEHPVARRRNQWTSPQEMFERFRQRHPFDLWREDILSDYCRYGVNKITNELFELACPPRTEAPIYMGSAGMNIADFIAAISNPVTVMRAFRSDVERAEMDFAQSPTWPDLSNHFINGRDLYFPELTHFIPMQKPEVVSAEIVTALSI